MDEPIDERNDAAGVREHFLPLREWFIGGDDRALFLVAPVEQFKEQVRVTIRVGQIALLSGLKSLQINGFRLPFKFPTFQFGCSARQI